MQNCDIHKTAYTAIYLCIAIDTMTVYGRCAVYSPSVHMPLHGFCSIASGVIPVPTMVLLLVSLHLYIGAVAMVVSLPEIPGSPHTPDEWFSKEQFSANPTWAFFSKEV